MKKFASLFLIFTILFVQEITAQSNSETSFMFGHSLLDHRPPLIATPSDETTIAHWIYLLATESGQSYAAAGQYGFLQQHDNLPPFSQWGYDIVPPAWDSDVDPFSVADFSNALITAGNFMQWQGPDEDYYNEPGVSPISATQTIVNWLVQNEPGIKIYIYENWPDMAPYIAGQGFPPSPTELTNYYSYLDGDFHNWWIAYHDALLLSNPADEVRMIPVGPILSNLFQNTVLNTIPVTEIYEDNAPHGRATLYFLAGMISYMATFEQPAPASFTVPNTVHPTVASNYSLIASNIWSALQGFNLPNGDSRVFFNQSLPTELVEFNGKYSNNSIELNWKTLSEINNEKFEIEYSNYGTHFYKIGEVAGNNTTAVEQQYSFTHRTVQEGWNYYRLRQIDFDGTFSLSTTVAIQIDPQGIHVNRFFPNPSVSGNVDLIYSSTNDAELEVNIYDLRGRLVFREKRSVTMGQNFIDFDLKSLGEGSFIVHIISGNKTEAHKITLN